MSLFSVFRDMSSEKIEKRNIKLEIFWVLQKRLIFSTCFEEIMYVFLSAAMELPRLRAVNSGKVLNSSIQKA